MGWQIIKQPNGLYCIFSSIVDDVIYYNGDRQQIVNAFIQDRTKELVKDCNQLMDELDGKEKAYGQFTMTFEEMLSTIKQVHGKKQSEKMLSKMR